MPDAADPLSFPMEGIRLLNAKRYGLTQKDFSGFAAFMDRAQLGQLERQDEAGAELGSDLSSDKIRDFIIQRMTNRMSGLYAQGLGGQGQGGQGTPMEQMMSDADWGADWGLQLFGSPSQKTDNLSGLLNMHFDLNTLQMLNKT